MPITCSNQAIGVAAFGTFGLQGKMSRKPPMELFPDMDRQAKLRPMEPNRFFANGISSHCHHFDHEHPHKTRPQVESACTCREECKPNPCGAAVLAAEPEIVELHDEVKRLRASFHRLDLHIKVEEPNREEKERRKEEKKERAKK